MDTFATIVGCGSGAFIGYMAGRILYEALRWLRKQNGK